MVSVKITWRMTEGNGGNNSKKAALTTVCVRSCKMAFGSYSSLQISFFFSDETRYSEKGIIISCKTYVSHWRNTIFSLLRFCSLKAAISCFDLRHFLVQTVIDRCGGLRISTAVLIYPPPPVWFEPLIFLFPPPSLLCLLYPFLMWVLAAELFFSPSLWEQASNHSNFLITFC